jgi:hypothetical protein
VLGAALFPEPGRPRLAHALALADRALARLDRRPELVIDEPQVRHLFDQQARRAPAAAHRVLDKALPVPDAPADIELVVEDAGAAGDVAADCSLAPRPAEGPGTSSWFSRLAITRGLRPAAYSSTIRRTTAASASSIRRVPVCPGTRSYPKQSPPPDIPLRTRPLKAAVGLLGEILHVQGVHCALQADMELVDLPLGNDDEADAQIREVLIQQGDVRQVAGQAVQRLGHDDVKSPAARA